MRLPERPIPGRRRSAHHGHLAIHRRPKHRRSRRRGAEVAARVERARDRERPALLTESCARHRPPGRRMRPQTEPREPCPPEYPPAQTPKRRSRSTSDAERLRSTRQQISRHQTGRRTDTASDRQHQPDDTKCPRATRTRAELRTGRAQAATQGVEGPSIPAPSADAFEILGPRGSGRGEDS